MPALALLCLAPSLGRADQKRAEALIEEARAALARGDGIAGEMKLRTALAQGAARVQVSAYMGQAYLAQGDRAKAREWLGARDFEPASAAAGWRALAALERQDGNLAAAGRAYDKALAITPDDATLWVEIGRLRYAGGEHALAIQASERALTLDPKSVRALEFRGELVRDRYGLVAALPWFDAALSIDKNDVAVLLEYAATLGDLGRNAQMLTLTRRVLEMSPKNPRAYYLQAVMAARAGNAALARKLIARTGGKLDQTPGMLLLQGTVEAETGNYAAATGVLAALLRQRPDNRRAKDLLARALYLGGEYRYATQRFAGEIARGEASPYLLTTVARAYEALDERGEAGELLDRAAVPQRGGLQVVASAGRVGSLMAQGDMHGAEDVAEAARRADPGTYESLSLAGDVQLARGRAAAAQARYTAASEIRMPESLFLRRLDAYSLAGDFGGAAALVEAFLGENPTNRNALRAAAWLSAGSGDAARARGILAWLRDNGSDGDVQLLADLALLEAAGGDAAQARTDAAAAFRLQRSNPAAAQALAYSYALTGFRGQTALSLLEKARARLGDTAIIAEARRRLASPAPG